MGSFVFVVGSTQPPSPRRLFAGAYDDEEAAARAHDLAALKYWGPATVLNFPVRTGARPPFGLLR